MTKKIINIKLLINLNFLKLRVEQHVYSIFKSGDVFKSLI